MERLLKREFFRGTSNETVCRFSKIFWRKKLQKNGIKGANMHVNEHSGATNRSKKTIYTER